MKNQLKTLLFSLALSGGLLAHPAHPIDPADETENTPANTRIAAARKAISDNPENPSAYPELALALASRARETANGAYYSKAMKAVEKSLELAPDNFQARKAEAWVLLGQHRFQEALVATRALVKRSGDDSMAHAMRTDAAIETGHYEEAEEAAQWALDMDPGGSPGLTRAAYLRELFGDFDGAIELMKLAFNRTRPGDSENRAWLLTHLGHLYHLKNNLAEAEKAHQEALELFPDYHYALANLADVRAAQGDHLSALELRRRHHAKAPHAESLYELACAMRRAGHDEEADQTFARFAKAARHEIDHVDNTNRELVAYLIDHQPDPAEALRVAEIEIASRQDFRTRHAYARALHANGRFSDAHAEMKRALEIGVKYPVVLYHAGMIARDAGDIDAAREHFQQSLAQAPTSVVAEDAAAALEAL